MEAYVIIHRPPHTNGNKMNRVRGRWMFKNPCKYEGKCYCNIKERWRNVQSTLYTIICLKSVGVRKLHVAILARSPREMSQTDRILPRYILSRVRVSVRPRIFLYAKKNQTRVARKLFISIDPLCGQINYWIGNCRNDPAGWRGAKASAY